MSSTPWTGYDALAVVLVILAVVLVTLCIVIWRQVRIGADRIDRLDHPRAPNDRSEDRS